MDYGRADLADRLAAEYVLGTLQGAARRRFESLLPAHPQLGAGVAAWRARLMPLASRVRPVQPSAAVWQAIENQLFARVPTAAARVRWWQQLAVWRSVAALSLAAAMGFGVLLMQPPPTQPPVVIVLSANPEAAAAVRASFVASLSADGRSLVLKPIDVGTIDIGRALELWAVPPQGAPRSLGLVSAQQATTVLRAQLLRDTAAFAVSLEPAGGSPTGAPTGPIVSLGKLQI